MLFADHRIHIREDCARRVGKLKMWSISDWKDTQFVCIACLQKAEPLATNLAFEILQRVWKQPTLAAKKWSLRVLSTLYDHPQTHQRLIDLEDKFASLFNSSLTTGPDHRVFQQEQAAFHQGAQRDLLLQENILQVRAETARLIKRSKKLLHDDDL